MISGHRETPVICIIVYNVAIKLGLSYKTSLLHVYYVNNILIWAVI